MKISAVLITFNEADRIRDALETCRGVADEIVVLDSFSTDATAEIAREYGAAFHQRAFTDFGSQKNAALEKASHDWVLSLDADERLSAELRDEIVALKGRDDPGADGFLVNRRTYYLGRWIRHSGWYPDRKLRLFRRSRARWEGRIHEKVVLDGPVSRLRGDIVHHTYRDVADHVARVNHYSGLQAREILARGTRLLRLRSILAPPSTFLRSYVFKLGFLDGYPGLVVAVISSWAAALKYLKAHELREEAGAPAATARG